MATLNTERHHPYQLSKIQYFIHQMVSPCPPSMLDSCCSSPFRVAGDPGACHSSQQVRGGNTPWIGHQTIAGHTLIPRNNLESYPSGPLFSWPSFCHSQVSSTVWPPGWHHPYREKVYSNDHPSGTAENPAVFLHRDPTDRMQKHLRRQPQNNNANDRLWFFSIHTEVTMKQ